MIPHPRRFAALLASAMALLCVALTVFSDAPTRAERRARAQKLQSAGNFKEAYEDFRALVLDPAEDPPQAGQDLDAGVNCLRQLGRTDEVDGFREEAVQVHARDWRLLRAAAWSCVHVEPYGFIISGKFQRGSNRGGDGRYVNSVERDRVRALQLMTRALERATADGATREIPDLHHDLASLWMLDPWGRAGWRLQHLTDLSTLPDYDDGYRYYGGRQVGAPVNPDGSPAFYAVPSRYEDAATDGERWRWALNEVQRLAPDRADGVRFELASFFRQQFDVHTMATYGRFFAEAEESDDKAEAGPYALQTLGEDETIARLATGVKRFKLPDEFNFLKILRDLADHREGGYAVQALYTLAETFSNRRQYDKAADILRRGLREHANAHTWQASLDQIVAPWGQFEPTATQAAETTPPSGAAPPSYAGGKLDFRFRNGERVHFEAYEIKVRTLLDDVKEYVRSNPQQLDWQKLQIENVGWRLVEKQETRYLGEKAAAWDLALKPRPGHFDRRIAVATPLKRAGAYLVTAKIDGGNTSRIVLWLADTVIVKKPMHEATYFFVADAASGRAVPGATLECFGYRQEHVGGNRYRVDLSRFVETADADGQAIVDAKRLDNNRQWLFTATTPDGRLAYLGFTGVWHGSYYDYEYNQTKVFVITDRPVYRPGQPVKFKVWVRHAKYDQTDTSSYARRSFGVEVKNPKGEVFFSRAYTADDYGGFDGEIALPRDATLGVYGIVLPHIGGGGSFRVEEYKKPEFEVTVSAPEEPLMLGEKAVATITAKYYFGAPVTKAKVKYKVLRSEATAHWYPPCVWDWFYGPGYWWFAYDYLWYPGWREWGCRRPIPWWWNWSPTPPEVVAETEVPIGPDGTVKFDIDTAPAQSLHGDADHRYEIAAEVTDESRRTIVGTGRVLVARKPFRVYAWVDRGYYRVGDDIRAEFSAQTLDQKPVPGKGVLSLLKVAYNAKGEPVETPAQRWDLDADAQGRATRQIKASAAGQYRLSYKLTDAKGHTIEGGYLFVIRGESAAGGSFRFNDIELVPDQREYRPGESVKLMVNTERADGTVVLFVRPANGIAAGPPKVLRLQGKTAVEEIAVTLKDMPNFFVEAFTVADGRIHSEMREIVVPPERRVVNVEVAPSSGTYKPGEKARVKVRLTDLAGKPFVGSTALAIYDKALEYIAGGSNVPEIKAFFWKWRRSHHPQTESSLAHHSANLTRSGETPMQPLGVFGELVADDEGEAGGVRGGQKGGDDYRGRLKSEMREGAPVPSAPAAVGEAAANGGGRHEAKRADRDGEPPPAPPGPAPVQPTVRTKFADTAYWAAALTTDAQGQAEIELAMPENLTTWKVRAWAMGHGTQVGQGEVEVVTTKNLLLRLQAPRFFVEKDEVVLSANVHNYLKNAKSVAVSLELDGKCLDPLDAPARTVEIAAGGERRVDWRVKVVAEGEAVVRMKALTDEESDAMEMRFPAFVHGMMKIESFSGAIRPDQEKGVLVFRVPAERRVNDSRVEIRFSPTLAGALVDALPYLADYPYGCTEQTLSRFLPTAITHKVLLDMGVDLKAVRDKRVNLNAQEIGDPRERAAQWRRWNRNPVYDEATVRSMVLDGVARLTDMQLSDGGWGWFSGYGEHSWPHTTAHVVHGLRIALANDVAVAPGVLERGVAWLKGYQAEQVRMLKNAPGQIAPWKERADDLDAFVFMVLVDEKSVDREMSRFLDRDRVQLSVYGKALYGMALHALGEANRLAEVLRNIDQYVVHDEENQTAFLRLPNEGYWWCWYGSGIESHAYYLKLLARTDPKGRTAPALVKYLLNNRKHATYWNSTRDTALCIEAMADYLRASGEARPDMTVEVFLDGKRRKEVRVTPETLFTIDNTVELVGDAVEGGAHTVEFRKTGKGPLYFNAYVSYFSLEDFITRAGLEVKVDRKVYRLKAVDKRVPVAGARGQAVSQKVEKVEREELASGGQLTSGDLVEIELTIDSKNDYEYLVFEDLKAAGFEPVEVRSGYGGNDMGAYVELRDDRVAFFVRALARGRHSVAYRLRAEIPGAFSALPARGYAMYAPELKGNSDEIKLKIRD